MGIAELLWSECRVIRPHLELISGTQNTFMLLRLPQGSSRLVTVFSGTLWRSIKEVKAPFVFDGEHGIALHAMQGNQASSQARGNPHGFSRVTVRTWGIFPSYDSDGPSKLVFLQQHQESCLVAR